MMDKCDIDACRNEVSNGCIEHEVYLCKKHWAEHQKKDHADDHQPDAARVASDERGPDAPPATSRGTLTADPVDGAKKGTVGKCLCCERETKIAGRGVCSGCITQISRACKAGETTREELVAAGLLAPAKPRGASPVLDALKSKLAAFRARATEARHGQA